MCRSLAEGGRRCPHQGYSSGRANQAARQQLSRARRRLDAAETAGDLARITKAQAQVAAAQARVDASKPADIASAPAGAVRVVEQARTGAPAHKPAAIAGAPASAPTAAEPEYVEAQVESSIRDAYHAVLADGGGRTAAGWVDLADLRDRLSSDLDRATVDRVLDKMIESPDVLLQHELVQRTLTPRRRDAAVVVGDEPRHLMKLEAPQPAITQQNKPGTDTQPDGATLEPAHAGGPANATAEPVDAVASKADPAKRAWDNVAGPTRVDITGAVNSRLEKGGADALVKRLRYLEAKERKGTLRMRDQAEMHALQGAIATAKAKEEAAKLPTPFITDVVARFNQATNQEQATEVLSGLAKKELAQVASALNAPLRAGTKTDQVSQLLGLRAGQASQEAKTAARPPAKAITPTSEHVADAVAYLQWGAKRREEAAAALAGLTKKELAQVAGALDTPLKAGKKADQLNQLVEDIAGARIDRPAAAPKPTGRQAGMPRRTREEKQPSPHQESKPAVVQMAGPPVSGWPSDKPLLENNWGGFPTSPVHYHEDGPIGVAVRYMGVDKRMSIDGEPLANVLGMLATDVHRGRRTPQEGLDAMKELRDRLPDGSRARQSLDSAIWKIDAPRGPAPAVPDSTPEPLRKLVQELHDIPVVRAQPDREMEPLLQIINDVAAGRARHVAVEISRLAGRRHESYGDSGYRQIKDAINAAREGYNNYVREQKRKQT